MCCISFYLQCDLIFFFISFTSLHLIIASHLIFQSPLNSLLSSFLFLRLIRFFISALLIHVISLRPTFFCYPFLSHFYTAYFFNSPFFSAVLFPSYSSLSLSIVLFSLVFLLLRTSTILYMSLFYSLFSLFTSTTSFLFYFIIFTSFTSPKLYITLLILCAVVLNLVLLFLFPFSSSFYSWLWSAN